jgi:hypothetical protein
MKRSFILLFLVFIFTGVSLAQGIFIRGQIIDKLSRQPIIAASIILPDSTGTSSGGDGKFRLKINEFPIKLIVSHIAYGKTEVELQVDPKALIIIEMEEAVSAIGEVQISAKKLRILTEKDDFTLQDFACDKNHLWLLGYLKNQATRGRLWLSNLFGDTLNSIPVQNPERLYTDLFGNVHLVMRDSVYHMYSDGKKMLIAYAYDRSVFFQTISPIKAAFAGKLVYQEYLPGKQGLHSYFYSTENPKPFFLSVIRDSAEEARQIFEHIYGKNMYLLEMAQSPSPSARADARSMIADNKRTKSEVFNRQVQVPVFSLMDTLYMVNLYKDSLMAYNSAGRFIHSISINYHRDSLLFDVHYRNLSYLVDPITNRMFLLQRKTTSWILSEFFPSSGRVGQKIPLPDFPGMTGITAHGQAIYFLYPEKKYPFYVRLYRYQL